MITAKPAQERLAVVDSLRGIALLGILLVNMAAFKSPYAYAFLGTATGEAISGIDHAVRWLIAFLAEGKFYSTFSFLFGLGFALQLTRLEAQGAPAKLIYARRLGVLLLIGLAHATLIWSGDILVIYALLGFILLLFRQRAPRTILAWAGLLWAIPILLMAALVGLLALAASVPESAKILEQSSREVLTELRAEAQRALQAYGQGTVGEILRHRLSELGMIYLFGLFGVPTILAMFLLGLYAGRRGIFQDLSAHQALLRKVAWAGLLLGLPLNGAYAWLASQLATDFSLLALFQVLLFFFLAPALLCLGYLSVMTLLLQREQWQQRLGWLPAVGRTALSNYLLQSVIGTLIFYNYGLGLYGQVSVTVGLLLTLAIYIVQVLLSHWWLRRFRFGPAEWLWRSLTYGQRQPMRNA